MRKLAIILAMLAIMMMAVAPAAMAHVHVFNPSDECSGGRAPLGLLNPAGKDNQGTPQAADSPAPAKCAKNR